MPASSPARRRPGSVDGLPRSGPRPLPQIQRADAPAGVVGNHRIIYYVGRLAIAVLDVFPKDTRATPVDVIRQCKRRLADFRKVDES